MISKIWALRLFEVLFIALLIITQFSFQAISEGTGDYPPPANNDWVITQNTYIHAETFTVEHNITIESGGSLTLDNSTLILNSPDYGDLWIIVKNGGELNIINNSKLMEGETTVNYDFMYENGSSGEISDSEVANCGWDDGGTFLSSGGILIASENVIVANSSIHNNYMGMVIFGASPIIENNEISDNLKYGIILINSSSQIFGNKLSLNPVGIYSLYSSPELENNEIRDNGDGARFYYSAISMEGDKFSSNSPDDCATGACSSQESGKGIYLEGCNLTLQGVEISTNSKGLLVYYSSLDIQNSTFSDNTIDGISAEFSEGNFLNNVFSGNLWYGIRWMYSPLDVDSSNSFLDNTGSARIVLEWEVIVNVKDTKGDWVSNADLYFEGVGNSYSATTTILGTISKSVAQYIIANDGSKIEYNPYMITATKTASWDGVDYENSTSIQITENTELDIVIPLKKSDLVINEIGFSDTPRVGNKVNIRIKVSNIGEAAANNASIVLSQKDSQGKTSIVNKSTFSIGPGQDTTLSFSWIPDEDGETLVFAELDNTKNIKEVNEDNNELEISINVYQKEGPLFEDAYFMAGLITFLIILAGVSIYILALRKNGEKKEEE
jgi:parallel beta-helix repeat protein